MLIRNYTDLDVALGKKWQCCEMRVRGERGLQLPWVQQEQRPTQNGSCLESEAMSFNSAQGRRQNVTLRRAGLPCRGAAQCGGCLGSVAAPPGCQTPVHSPGAAGSESIPCQRQPFCSSAAHGSADGELWAVAAAALKGWSGKSCSCGRQQLDRKKISIVPVQNEAVPITDKSSNAAHCCIVICTAIQSREKCMFPECKELT